MLVIVFYDISTESKNSVKVLKLCRKYLKHIQKSVFKGELSESQYTVFVKEIKKMIDIDLDSIVILKIDNEKFLKQTILGKQIESDKDIFL